MKIAPALFVAAAYLASAPCHAQRSEAPHLLGSWAVDVTRFPMPPAARPKSVTLTFSQSADGKYHTDVAILAPDGSERKMTGAYTADGTPYAIEGDTMEADIAAVTFPTPTSWSSRWARTASPPRPASTR